MKNAVRLFQLLVVGGFLLCPLISRAEDQPTYRTTVFQVGLVNPVQLFPADYSVDDFRLNLIYGANENLNGIDLGMVNQSRGNARGLELGMVNLDDKEFRGLQLGLFNVVRRNFMGLQLGALANVTSGSFEGFQAAVFFNDADVEAHGLQLGLINHTGSLYGVQIGLLNFNDDTKYLGFLPFINAAF